MTDAFNFDRDAYLQRIGLQEGISVNVEGLTRLSRAQLFTIAFENFDIQLGRRLDLSPGALFRKLVLNRRGGYCFELNSLFCLALRAFGFTARPALARVRRHGGIHGRTHLLTLVSLQGRDWITDVGFGANGLRAPVPLEAGYISSQDQCRIRLVDGSEFGTIVQVEKEDGWQDIYSFDTGVVCPADIEMSNHFTETHPRSSFVRYRFAFLPTHDGSHSLLDFSLRTVNGEGTRLETLQPGRQYVEKVEAVFAIDLGIDYGDLKPVGQEL